MEKVNLVTSVEILKIENGQYYIADGYALKRVTKNEFVKFLQNLKWIDEGWNNDLKCQYHKILKLVGLE